MEEMNESTKRPPPYSKLVCFMELMEDGEIHQLKDIDDKRRAYYNAIDGKCKFLRLARKLAVRPVYH